MLLNFNSIPDYIEREFKPLPDGNYKAMLFSMNLEKTKNNDDMITIGYKVLNDPFDFPNRIIKDYYVLNNERGLSKLKKLLQLSNIDISNDINIFDLIKNGDLLGKKYNMHIVTNEYTNKYNKTVTGNKIKSLLD